MSSVIRFVVRGGQIWLSGIAAGAGVACLNIALRLIVASDDYQPMSWQELRVEAFACLALSFFIFALGAIPYYFARRMRSNTPRQKWWRALVLGFILAVTLAVAGSFAGYFFEEFNNSIVGRLRAGVGDWLILLTVIGGLLLFLAAKLISPSFWTVVIDAIRSALSNYFQAPASPLNGGQAGGATTPPGGSPSGSPSGGPTGTTPGSPTTPSATPAP